MGGQEILHLYKIEASRQWIGWNKSCTFFFRRLHSRLAGSEPPSAVGGLPHAVGDHLPAFCKLLVSITGWSSSRTRHIIEVEASGMRVLPADNRTKFRRPRTEGCLWRNLKWESAILLWVFCYRGKFEAGNAWCHRVISYFEAVLQEAPY